MKANHVNPFAQSERYWKATFLLPSAAVGTAENAFDDGALSVATFETDEKNHIWTFDLLYAEKPDREELHRRLLLISSLHAVPMPELKIMEVEQRDWLAAVARDFPPLSVGRFYIHGAHVKTPPPAGSIGIKIDAGAAFGSGEHGTTGTCLEALDWLAKRRDFKNVLDMGCGSGILAIAAAKLWNAEVLAADIDPVAVAVTKDNARINRVRLEAVVSDGYADEHIRRHAPYDLIVSNILARPLVKFAPQLAKHLRGDLPARSRSGFASAKAGGVAVLSGLLSSQVAQVKSAHVAQGLALERQFSDGDWRTLVFVR